MSKVLEHEMYYNEQNIATLITFTVNTVVTLVITSIQLSVNYILNKNIQDMTKN